ncbi:MAG: class I SAM-dependent methyltransferase [Thermoplasmata archaeon]
MTNDSLYLEGEEKFGSISSCIYGKILTPILKRYYNIIINEISERKVEKLLDVGCGPGKVVTSLAKVMNNTYFYCIDPSPSMIKIAKKNALRYGIENRINIAVGSSREIPFNEKFDAIISSFSYHHWKDRDMSLQNLVNYLNNEGFIYIYEYDNDLGKLKNSHGVSEEEWNNLKINGVKKEIDHKNGLIILRLLKQ